MSIAERTFVCQAVLEDCSTERDRCARSPPVRTGLRRVLSLMPQRDRRDARLTVAPALRPK